MTSPVSARGTVRRVVAYSVAFYAIQLEMLAAELGCLKGTTQRVLERSIDVKKLPQCKARYWRSNHKRQQLVAGDIWSRGRSTATGVELSSQIVDRRLVELFCPCKELLVDEETSCVPVNGIVRKTSRGVSRWRVIFGPPSSCIYHLVSSEGWADL